MGSGFKLSILSPERRLVEGVQVEEVTLPGSEGQIEILPDHAPMVGSLQTGLFRYHSVGKPVVEGVISAGFFEMKNNELNVLAETLELKSEIDVDRARKAQQLAEETLKNAELDEHHFKEYQLKLQRSIIRQQIAGRE